MLEKEIYLWFQSGGGNKYTRTIVRIKRVAQRVVESVVGVSGGALATANNRRTV